MAKPCLSSRHRRHHSWPPFRLQTFAQTPSIDEDPFAFFISASGDLEGLADDHITADIESARPRSLSPFHLVRRKEPKAPELSSTTAVSKLRRWIHRLERRYFKYFPQFQPKPSTSPPTFTISPTKAPHNSPISPNIRGRSSSRGATRRFGDNALLSHSPRPRVWKEPSGSIYPVLEEQEDVGLGISLAGTPQSAGSEAVRFSELVQLYSPSSYQG